VSRKRIRTRPSPSSRRSRRSSSRTRSPIRR
jgi:hypothetical protein